MCLLSFCLVAGSILSKMDKSVNPCDDFYTFSCGGWLNENPIPEDSSSYGIYPWLRQEVDIKIKGRFAWMKHFLVFMFCFSRQTSPLPS